jgi:hypothetical protein
MDTY